MLLKGIINTLEMIVLACMLSALTSVILRLIYRRKKKVPSAIDDLVSDEFLKTALGDGAISFLILAIVSIIAVALQ